MDGWLTLVIRTQSYGADYEFACLLVHGVGRMVGGEEGYHERYVSCHLSATCFVLRSEVMLIWFICRYVDWYGSRPGRYRPLRSFQEHLRIVFKRDIA